MTKVSIRAGVFETNSSSVHALSITNHTALEVLSENEVLLDHISKEGIVVGRPKDWKYPNSAVEKFERKLATLIYDCSNDPYADIAERVYQIILAIQDLSDILECPIRFNKIENVAEEYKGIVDLIDCKNSEEVIKVLFDDELKTTGEVFEWDDELVDLVKENYKNSDKIILCSNENAVKELIEEFKNEDLH